MLESLTELNRMLHLSYNGFYHLQRAVQRSFLHYLILPIGIALVSDLRIRLASSRLKVMILDGIENFPISIVIVFIVYHAVSHFLHWHLEQDTQ